MTELAFAISGTGIIVGVWMFLYGFFGLGRRR